MTTKRIKEIQAQTGYRESKSVAGALLQVWNECGQEYNTELTTLRAQLEEARKQIGIYDASRQSAWKILEDAQAENAALKKEVEKRDREQRSMASTIDGLSFENSHLESSRDEFAIKFAEWVIGDRRPQTWFASTEDLLEQFKETFNETPGTTDPS